MEAAKGTDILIGSSRVGRGPYCKSLSLLTRPTPPDTATKTEIRPAWRGYRTTEALRNLLRAIKLFIPLSEREYNCCGQDRYSCSCQDTAKFASHTGYTDHCLRPIVLLSLHASLTTKRTNRDAHSDPNALLSVGVHWLVSQELEGTVFPRSRGLWPEKPMMHACLSRQPRQACSMVPSNLLVDSFEKEPQFTITGAWWRKVVPSKLCSFISKLEKARGRVDSQSPGRQVALKRPHPYDFQNWLMATPHCFTQLFISSVGWAAAMGEKRPSEPVFITW